MPCARQASQDVSQQTRRAATPNTICFIQSTHQAPASHVNSAQTLQCGVQHNISGDQGSTTLQTQPRHSSTNLCSYRCHKPNILPCHSSKAQTLNRLLCSEWRKAGEIEKQWCSSPSSPREHDSLSCSAHSPYQCRQHCVSLLQSALRAPPHQPPLEP